MTAASLERRLVALSSALDRACSQLALFALCVMLVSILLQVIARYVFDAPPPWTEELGRYAMVWSGMLGATMAYFRRADPVLVRARAESGPAGELARQLLELLAVIVFVAPVLYFTPGFLGRHSHRITETLEFNSAFVVAIVPVSLVVLLVHQCARVATALHVLRQRPVP